MAGAAVVVVIAMLAVTQLNTGNRPQGGPAASPVAASGRIPDISTMTPRELANATFDRTMIAAEQGKQDTVLFFAPKALQAYAMLVDLDEDAHYHIGLIHHATGDYDAALAQADTIAAAVSTHLFALDLRLRVARARGGQTAITAALRAFLDNYEAERAADRAGYDDHARLLEQVRDEAQQALGGAGSD